MDAKQTFYSDLTSLVEYCRQSVTDLQPILAEKNQEAVKNIKGNPETFGSALTEKITQAATIQKKIDLFHATLNHIEHILDEFYDLDNITKKIPNSVESLLWLLSKFEQNDFLAKIESVIQELYGSDTLEDLKKFTHINVGNLTNTFSSNFSRIFLREYAYLLEMMYNTEKKPDTSQPQEDISNKNSSPNPSPIKSQKDSSNDTSNQKDVVHEAEMPMKENIPPPQTVTPCNVIEEEKINDQKILAEPEQNWDNLKITSIKGVNLEGLNNYRKIQEALLASGQKFTDPDFPPAMSSITTDPSNLSDLPKIVWKRIPELFKDQKLSVCRKNIGPDDIYQGNLKDCYLMSALIALSERKPFIHRLFESKEITPTGCYSIWLCDSGEWKNIIVDDYIPCFYKNKVLKPYFAMIRNNDIWVCLLEKAYAKKHGSYMVLQRGFQMEAFHCLTGAPVRNYKQTDNKANSIEKFWTFITTNLEKKFVITSSVRDEDSCLNNEGMGLANLHAYAFLEAREIQLPDGNKERLVRLRNPWGYGEWKGKWSDYSTCWTPEIMKMLNYNPKKNDGEFWMTVEDIDKHFYQSFVCKIQSTHTYYPLWLAQKKKQDFFIVKMRLDQDANVFLGIQQKVRKHFAKGSGYEYSYARMHIARLRDNKIVSVFQGVHDWGHSVVVEHNFVKGLFLLFIEVEWVQDLCHQIMLTAYSNQKVVLTQEPIENYDTSSLFLEIVRTQILHMKDHRYQTVQYSLNQEKKQIWKYEVRRFGLGAMLYINKEKDIDFYVNLDMKPSKNMRLGHLQGGGSVSNIHVPCGEERLVIFRAEKVLKTYKDFSFNYSETYKIYEIFTDEQLKEICQQTGERIWNSEDGTVEALRFEYDGGLAFCYVNRGAEATFEGRVNFDGDNLLINGEEKSQIELIIPPGQTVLVRIRPKNPFEQQVEYNRTNGTIQTFENPQII